MRSSQVNTARGLCAICLDETVYSGMNWIIGPSRYISGGTLVRVRADCTYSRGIAMTFHRSRFAALAVLLAACSDAGPSDPVIQKPVELAPSAPPQLAVSAAASDTVDALQDVTAFVSSE